MFPIRNIISNPRLCHIYESFPPRTILIYHQTLRWLRKPFWLPMAKSKVFRIPTRIRPPPEEQLEIKKLHDHYHTYFKSIRKYCILQDEKACVNLDENYIQKLQDEDFERCSKINDEWNVQLAKDREERMEKEKNEKIIKIIQHMESVDKKIQMEQEIMKAKIMQAKLDSVTFITEKNIDQAIEEAINNVVNYDKVLDISGNFYEVKPDQKISQSKQ